MQEIDATKGSGNTRVDIPAGTGNGHESVTTNMRENIALAQLDQCQFSIVTMSKEV